MKHELSCILLMLSFLLSACATPRAVVTDPMPGEALSARVTKKLSKIKLNTGRMRSIKDIQVKGDSLYYMIGRKKTWTAVLITDVDAVLVKHPRPPKTVMGNILLGGAIGAGIGFASATPGLIEGPGDCGLGCHPGFIALLTTVGGGTVGLGMGLLANLPTLWDAYVPVKDLSGRWRFVTRNK